MPRRTKLDQQWDDLMSMCAREKEYQTESRHPKLLRFVTRQIDELAAEMGFSARQIKKREFRATREGGHVAKILID